MYPAARSSVYPLVDSATFAPQSSLKPTTKMSSAVTYKSRVTSLDRKSIATSGHKLSKRAKALPMESMFKTEIPSVRQRNQLKKRSVDYQKESAGGAKSSIEAN